MTNPITLRPYQQQAASLAAEFLRQNPLGKGLIVVPTGGGKSIIIAALAKMLNQPVLIICPSKEILEQNYEKMRLYSDEVGLYSASVRKTEINTFTFATIGTVANHPSHVSHFNCCIVDECHRINPVEGLYRKLLDTIKCGVIGLTATPCRLIADGRFERQPVGKAKYTVTRSMLQPITQPMGYFDTVIHVVQVGELSRQGYLAPVQYYVNTKGWRDDLLQLNATGNEFADWSIRYAIRNSDLNRQTVSVANRLIEQGHRGIVFCHTIDDAVDVMSNTTNCMFISSQTPKLEREEILRRFRAGEIKCIVNVGILIIGFDDPAMDFVIMACPTNSLTNYYQEIGRAVRLNPKDPNKKAIVIDMVGNYNRFREVAAITFENRTGEWHLYSGRKQLTGVWREKNKKSSTQQTNIQTPPKTFS